MGARVLVVDNYDSFVYNLVQELGELGAEPVVYRNDAISVEGIRAERPDAVLVSPGPGRPEDGGVSLAAIAELAGEIRPIALFTTINRQGILTLWPVKLPGTDGRIDSWNASGGGTPSHARQDVGDPP